MNFLYRDRNYDPNLYTGRKSAVTANDTDDEEKSKQKLKNEMNPVSYSTRCYRNIEHLSTTSSNEEEKQQPRAAIPIPTPMPYYSNINAHYFKNQTPGPMVGTELFKHSSAIKQHPKPIQSLSAESTIPLFHLRHGSIQNLMETIPSNKHQLDMQFKIFSRSISTSNQTPNAKNNDDFALSWLLLSDADDDHDQNDRFFYSTLSLLSHEETQKNCQKDKNYATYPYSCAVHICSDTAINACCKETDPKDFLPRFTLVLATSSTPQQNQTHLITVRLEALIPYLVYHTTDHYHNSIYSTIDSFSIHTQSQEEEQNAQNMYCLQQQTTEIGNLQFGLLQSQEKEERHPGIWVSIHDQEIILDDKKSIISYLARNAFVYTEFMSFLSQHHSSQLPNDFILYVLLIHKSTKIKNTSRSHSRNEGYWYTIQPILKRQNVGKTKTSHYSNHTITPRYNNTTATTTDKPRIHWTLFDYEAQLEFSNNDNRDADKGNPLEDHVLYCRLRKSDQQPLPKIAPVGIHKNHENVHSSIQKTPSDEKMSEKKRNIFLGKSNKSPPPDTITTPNHVDLLAKQQKQIEEMKSQIQHLTFMLSSEKKKPIKDDMISPISVYTISPPCSNNSLMEDDDNSLLLHDYLSNDDMEEDSTIRRLEAKYLNTKNQ